VHLQDLNFVSWKEAEVRAPIGSHNGSPNALLHITLQPGKSIAVCQFSTAEAIYYIEAGEGKITPEQDIHPDSFAFVPKGIAHDVQNTGESVLEMFLVLTGAGSLEEAV
jgi:mannose-6-phosphate isomerase-like protein (cupin superfamily)